MLISRGVLPQEGYLKEGRLILIVLNSSVSAIESEATQRDNILSRHVFQISKNIVTINGATAL